MDLAWFSLLALLVVVIASCTSAINPGVLSLILACLIGIYVAPQYGRPLGSDADAALKVVVGGFPSNLFLTLVGVTLFFSMAQVNGTLDRVTHLTVRCCRGNAGLVPILFFLLAALLASVGAGNIAASALLSPLAMRAAQKARIPPFLMAIMVCHGAIAGALSPFSPTGVIANRILRERLPQLESLEWQLYLHNFLANVLVACGGYLLFGGWRLLFLPAPLVGEGLGVKCGVRHPAANAAGSPWCGEPAALAAGSPSQPNPLPPEESGEPQRLEPQHQLTLLIIGLLLVAVLGYGADVGMAAFAGAGLLTLLRLSDENRALSAIPWSVIVMVCGVTVLTSLLEKTGGTQRLTEMIGWVSTPATVTGVIAFVVGVISVYSSTSGVVLPAFLPLVPGLAAHVGGDPQALASSIIVGGHLVDTSPLSTIGALCIACSGTVGDERRVLFNQLLFWGLSMAVVGAVGCYLVF